MEAIRSSETSVNTRPTQRHIPEDGILYSHRCESLRSYMLTSCFINPIFSASGMKRCDKFWVEELTVTDGREVNGTRSGSYPMMCFGIVGVEPLPC
jgi:hypothetical protein